MSSQDKKLNVTARMHPEVRKLFKKHAKAERMTVGALARELILKFLRDKGETIEHETLRSDFKSAKRNATSTKRLEKSAL